MEVSRAEQGVIIYAVPSSTLKTTAMPSSSAVSNTTHDRRWQWHAGGAKMAYMPGAAMKDPLPPASTTPAPDVIKVPASHPSLDAILDNLVPADPTTAAVGAVFLTTDTLPNPYDPLDKRSLTVLVSGVSRRNAARLAAM